MPLKIRVGLTLLGLFLAVGLISCATPYQEKGFTGGYTEDRINDSSYLVYFYGNGHASQDRVWYFWLYRCAELTLEKGYDEFFLLPKTFAPPQQARLSSHLIAAVYRPGHPGHLTPVHASGGGVTTFYYGGGGSITRWNSSGVVVMLRGPLPEGAVYAIDARRVIAQLQAYVTSNGATTPPSRSDLLEASYITHTTLEIGLPVVRGTTVSSPVQSNSAPKPQRSADELRASLRENVLQLHAAFQSHWLASPAQPSGTVVVAFDVSPNGVVGNTRIVSSSFADPACLDALRIRIAQMNFGVRDVVDTAVLQLPLRFSPAAPSPRVPTTAALPPGSLVPAAPAVPATPIVIQATSAPTGIPADAVVAPVPAVPANPGSNQRSLGEVEVVLGYRKPAIDRAVIHDTDGTAGPGAVQVDFVVEPNGAIDQVKLVSSSFQDPRVSASIIRSLQGIQLQGKDVAPLSVAHYSIAVN